MRIILLHLLFSTILTTTWWAQAKVANPTPQTPEPLTQLTYNGDNRQPMVIEDHRMLYVSRNRREHKDPQIYVRDLISGDEKRITYQRGHMINGAWLTDNKKLVYASSTDEEKETPRILKKYLSRFPASIDTQFFFHLNIRPTEIYSSQVDGTEITRLSNHPGFDAFPAYHTKTRTLYFSRLDQGKINIYSQSYGSKKRARKVMETHGHDLGLQLSPQKDKFVWYRFSPDFKNSQIMMSDPRFKDQQLLTIDDGIQWSPSWHPQQKTVLFSAKKAKDKNYQIYEVSLDDQCQRQLTSLKGDEFYPVVSPDGRKLLFTATLSGGEQIHQMAYPTPFTCDKKL